MRNTAESYTILIVDDEPDMHVLTQLALKNMHFENTPLHMAFAHSGQEAINYLVEHPETAVILMDVVMETESAGLEAVAHIRQSLDNSTVRILLRTGQPGAAPEQKVIENYEIDGYLSKAEMTKMRLFTAVRTALKAYKELCMVQKLEKILTLLHQGVIALNRHQDLPNTLQALTELTAQLSGCELVLMYLKAPQTEQEHYLLYSIREDLEVSSQTWIQDILTELNSENPNLTGTMVPLVLEQEAGSGWLYLNQAFQNEPIAQQVLPLLAGHATSAIYRSLLKSVPKH